MHYEAEIANLNAKLDEILTVQKQILAAITGKPAKRQRTQVTDALASEVVYLMTRPENRKRNGSVNKSAVAKAAGINIKTLDKMPEAQQAIDVIEGRYGRGALT